MFLDVQLTRGGAGNNKRDDDGAKRLFFGGERFLDGISGDAYVRNADKVNFHSFSSWRFAVIF